MNTITIELCAEDRARLDRLAAALEANTPPFETFQPDFLSKKMNLPKETPAPVAEETPPWEESKPAVTMEQLQALAQELLAPGSGKSAAVRKLIKSYAERVSLIPQDKWAEVYDALTALKEG